MLVPILLPFMPKLVHISTEVFKKSVPPGAKASVALNPHTPRTCFGICVGPLDLVLVMSVNPGFGGQSHQ